MSFFEDVAASIFKPSAYARFLRQKGGRALVYLLLIALPLALTGAIRVGGTFAFAMDKMARFVAASPDFRVANGVLEFDAPQPYRITADGQEFGVVDTTGATDRSVLAGKEHYLLVLRDRLVVRSGVEIRELAYKDFGEGAVASRASISAFFSRFGGLGWFLGVFWVAGSLAAKLIAALLLATLVLAVGAGRARAATFGSSWAVACHALTLSLVLGFARVLMSASIWGFWLLYWGLAIVYGVAATSLMAPARPSAPALATGGGAPPPGGGSPPTGGEGAPPS